VVKVGQILRETQVFPPEGNTVGRKAQLRQPLAEKSFVRPLIFSSKTEYDMDERVMGRTKIKGYFAPSVK
jgi:hypothetical protein